MIGILTLSASDNCGSLLQAYALQQYFARYLDVRSEIIDFRPRASETLYSIFPANPLAEKRRALNAVCHYRLLKLQKADYEEFRHEWLGMSADVCRNAADLAKKACYSRVVVGSDQVWNVRMPDFDMAYFLEWFQGDKYAYAPSVGGHFIQESPQAQKIAEALRRFKMLSSREDLCKSSVERLTGHDVELVLDPTLLLSAEEWQEIAPEKLIEGEYIFYYSWAYNSDAINSKVQEFAEKTGLPVYVINAFKWLRYKPRRYGFHMSRQSGPQAFLSLMKHAKFALVQSFHGVIFAWQMGVPFFFLDDQPEEKMDVRLRQVLTLLDCMDRVLRPEDELGKMLEKAAERKAETKALELLRKTSGEYLKEIVS